MWNSRLILNSLCEFGPIIAFLVAFSFGDFSTGIIAMMVATFVSLLILKYKENTIPFFALISSVTVLLFGSLSLLADMPTLFIFRDTLFDVFFGTVLLVSVYRNKPLFKYLFRGVFAITDRGWRTLSLRWGIFFYILALANEIARFTLSPDAWVLAKVSIVVISCIFGAYQFTLTRRERLPTATPWGIVR